MSRGVVSLRRFFWAPKTYVISVLWEKKFKFCVLEGAVSLRWFCWELFISSDKQVYILVN